VLGKQGGVALLVSPKTEFEVLQWKKDTSGRVLSVLAHLRETNPSERNCFLILLEIIFAGTLPRFWLGILTVLKARKIKFSGNFVSANELKELRRNVEENTR